jgi:hypothetical protein
MLLLLLLLLLLLHQRRRGIFALFAFLEDNWQSNNHSFLNADP